MSCSIKISAPGTGSLLSGADSALTDGAGAGIDADFLTEQEFPLINRAKRIKNEAIVVFINQKYKFKLRLTKRC